MLSQNGGHAGHCKALDAVGACSLQAITRFPMLANANGTADRYVISSNEARRCWLLNQLNRRGCRER
jgi:hypothetical protein